MIIIYNNHIKQVNMLCQIVNLVKENKSRLDLDDYFMSIALLAAC